MSPYSQPTPTLDVSVVVPIYNESGNVVPLADAIVCELGKLGRSFEVILVNDGSDDGGADALDQVANGDARIKVIHFSRNSGQTIAIAAGMYHAAGKVIVLMDGDRQNDPSDIGRMIQKLEQGYDCVSGWRKDRQDSGIRKLPSRLANAIVNRVTGVPIHDLGCTLKAYRRGAIDPCELLGEMHRFLAVYVHARGGRMTEMVVKHHARTSGQSKYGLNRISRVVSDIFLIQILLKYPTRPGHLFAKVAQGFFIASAAFGLLWILDAWWYASLTHGAMAFLVAIVLLATAVVILACGLVAELVVRCRFSVSGQRAWDIARMVNFDKPGTEAGES